VPAPRSLLPVLLALVALSAPGCGADDEGDVRETLDSFATAVAKKDYQQICDDLLAPDLVEEVRKAGPCEVALKTGLEDRRNPRIVVRSVKLDGDKAEARVRSTADGEQPSEDVVQLVKVDGGWRIASLAS